MRKIIDKYFRKPIKITPADIQVALDEQRNKASWDFYSERELLENTINQRVNFVLATYALFVTASASAGSERTLCFILLLGSLLLSILLLTTWRVYIRLDTVLQILYNAGDKHVFTLVKDEVEAWKNTGFGPMIFWIYVFVPAFCAISMWIWLFLVLFGWIEPTGKDEMINNFNYYYDVHSVESH